MPTTQELEQYVMNTNSRCSHVWWLMGNLSPDELQGDYFNKAIKEIIDACRAEILKRLEGGDE